MLPATNTLQQIENHENWQRVYKILADALPEREDIQDELGKLYNNKNQYVKQLQDLWAAKPTPLFTEVDIRRLCSNFYSNRTENNIVDGLLDRPTCEMNEKNWIVKTDERWIGWCAETSQYHDLPIRFDGEIKFERYYEQLIVNDRESGSCNIIWSIRKLIHRGGAACLSDSNWIALWLTFSKKYMASSYPTLARYSDNLEKLFQTMISTINADEEVAKLRASMAKLSRSPGTPLQVTLYRLKAYYELLVGINFPKLDPDNVTVRSENYASNCTKYFVSKNTRIALDNFIQMKQQKGEQTNVMNICQVIGQHEANNPSDQIQSIMFLPEHATRMDTQLNAASNVEELFINSTRVDRDRGYDFRRQDGPKRTGQSPAGSQGRNNVKPRDGFRKNSYFTSPGGGNYYRGRSKTNSNPSGGNNDRGSRPTTPRRHSDRRRSTSQRFQSPGGSKYLRSPGRTSFRRFSKSPASDRQSYNQDNRSRPTKPGSSQSQTCIRCGGAHLGSDCRKYDYWAGVPCAQCGLMHDSRVHRDRSSSNSRAPPATRATHPGTRKIQGFESEITPGTVLPVENQINYFSKN